MRTVPREKGWIFIGRKVTCAGETFGSSVGSTTSGVIEIRRYERAPLLSGERIDLARRAACFLKPFRMLRWVFLGSTEAGFWESRDLASLVKFVGETTESGIDKPR